MEFLKAQLTRVQEQLAGLTASQKMLTASLVAIMVMTVLWWSHWAAEPDMEPILNQPLSLDEMAPIISQLKAQGIPYRTTTDHLLVPPDRKMEILAELGSSLSLPKDFNSAFDELVVKQGNWLDPPSKTDRLFNEAKQRTLAQVISRMPGVVSASVVIDPKSERNIETGDVQPSAMVSITTGRNNKNTVAKSGARQLSQAVLAIVSGAQAGLAPNKINIVIDGLAMPTADPQDQTLSGGTFIELKTDAENKYRQKVMEFYANIANLMVAVDVKLDASAKTIKTHDIDPKKSLQMPVTTDERSSETTAPANTIPEAGAAPNTGLSIAQSPSGSAGGTSTTENKSTFQNDHFQSDQLENHPAGEVSVNSVAVRVPRSHFVADLKRDTNKDPDEPAIAAYISEQLVKMRGEVKATLGMKTEDGVIVAEYSDSMPAEAPLNVVGATSPVVAIITGYSKEIGVGVLALASLFMVSTMVRKGIPAPVTMPVSEPTEPNVFGPMETVAGEVGENNAMLDAVELDEGTIKSQQMLDQVQQMVQSNPDAAASLVKRWLNR